MKIGIDLGGSHIAIGVVDKRGKIIEKVEKRILASEKNNIKKVIETYIIEKVKNLKNEYEITEIGIAIPGTIKDGIIEKSVNLGLKNYDLIDSIKSEVNIPIKIRNDAKCAAIAENIYGTLKPYKRSIFLTLGTGIGGAVIINNMLLDTGIYPGCEFGHIVIEKDGKLCKCGKKGCWETVASMKAFKDSMRKVMGLNEKTSGKELLDIIRKNNAEDENYKVINDIIDEYINYLSLGISNLINIFEPEAIGIGGSFVFYKDIFVDKLKSKIISNNLLFNKRNDVNIQTAILNNDAGLIGATL